MLLEGIPERLIGMFIALMIYLFIATFLVLVIAAVSYGFLFLLNYLLTQYPGFESFIQISSYNIDLKLVLLTSILLSVSLAIVLIVETNFSNGDMIIAFNRSVSSDIASITEQAEKIEYNTSNIEDIKDQVSAMEFTITSELTNITNALETIDNTVDKLQK